MPVRLSLARLILCGLALVAARVGLPSAAAVAGPQQGPPVAPPPAQVPAAVLKGRVTDKKGAPLPGVLVRVAVPAADMRHVNPTTDHLRFEAQSDAEGNYRLEVPGIAEPTTVSIDAMAPGYRHLVGMPMRLDDVRKVDLAPGKEVAADLALEPALYCQGVVIDEQGRPVAGVNVKAYASSPRATGWVEETATGPDGAFELFNYPVAPVRFQQGEPSRGRVTCEHPDYVAAEVADIYALDGEGRAHLRVVLPTGRKVAGTVLDAAGQPVAGALVMAGPVGGMPVRRMKTDAAGRFALGGLGPGEAMLDARALAIKQKLKMRLTLAADKADLEVKLRPIEFPKDVKTYDVLGMKLADVTPELQAAYDLALPQGAVILDPGPDPGRLAIGAFAEGSEFFMAGKSRVGGLRDFVDRVIAETGGLDIPEYSVRVVYTFTNPEAGGSRTSYLKFTRDDLAQLKELAERLKAEAK